MPGTGWRQRQDLPERLAGRFQPVHKVARGRAQIARAMRPWQTGQVQEHAAGAARKKRVWMILHEVASFAGASFCTSSSSVGPETCKGDAMLDPVAASACT